MSFVKYQTEYVDDLPAIDEPCPLCEQGIIRQGKYSPYCSKCQVYFNVSKGSPSYKAKPKGEDQVMEALRVLYREVADLKRELKRFMAFFADKTANQDDDKS